MMQKKGGPGRQGRLPQPAAHTGRGRWAVALLAVLLAGCSMRELAVRGLADELATQGSAPEQDLDLLRDAAPYHLKLSEAVLRSTPDHLPLATSVTAGFVQYAYAFVAFPADQLEATQPVQAQQLRQRAARLYRRAQAHALQAFETRHPGFALALAASDPAQWPVLAADEVGLAYWAAAAWGAAIALSTDDPEAVADLPQARRLAELAARINPAYGDGALSSLLGSFAAAGPGRNVKQATEYFDLARRQAAGRSVGVFVTQAETLALPAGDKAQFADLLARALAVPARPDDLQALANDVMRQRARWLQQRLDDLF